MDGGEVMAWICAVVSNGVSSLAFEGQNLCRPLHAIVVAAFLEEPLLIPDDDKVKPIQFSAQGG